MTATNIQEVSLTPLASAIVASLCLSEEQAHAALSYVGDLNKEEGVEVLKIAAQNPLPSIRALAVRKIPDVKEWEKTELLRIAVNALYDESSTVRSAAVKTLWHSRERLLAIRTAIQDSSVEVRESAYELAARCSKEFNDENIPVFLSALREESERIRSGAIRGIKSIVYGSHYQTAIPDAIVDALIDVVAREQHEETVREASHVIALAQFRAGKGGKEDASQANESTTRYASKELCDFVKASVTTGNRVG